MGLGAGEASGAAVAGALRSPLILGTLSLVVIAALTWLVARMAARSSLLFTFEERRRGPLLLAGILGVLFFADAARRVAGTCPAGPPDLYRRETPAVALVAKEAGPGRFYDDGADDAPTVARRTREAGGLDLLRPATGVAFGIRYAGENDVDRMTAAASVLFARQTRGPPLGGGEGRAPAPARGGGRPDAGGAARSGRRRRGGALRRGSDPAHRGGARGVRAPAGGRRTRDGEGTRREPRASRGPRRAARRGAFRLADVRSELACPPRRERARAPSRGRIPDGSRTCRRETTRSCFGTRIPPSEPERRCPSHRSLPSLSSRGLPSRP